MEKVFITDLTLRDAHQCLIATRLRTEDMLPIAPTLEKIGFWALEVWGGATFDACLRFLKQSPWERLQLLRKALPNTRLSMLLRGQNLLGYRHYSDDVVDAFVDCACDEGVDVFRIFDALNDIRNLERSILRVKKNNRHAQGTICYTTSPVHNIEQFVAMGKQLEIMGCDSLAIKDMAGLLTPAVTEDLVKGLINETKLPVHLHSHATSGLSSICLYKAVESGCRHIDTAISSFAEGASHPATETMVAAFKNTQFDTALDLSLLKEVADYFKEVRKKYHQFESAETTLNPSVQLYQVPGGMISNLSNQLKEQQAESKLAEVYQEIPKVRKELGFPPLVTPTSQVVATQAVINVLTGERYKTITEEVKLYCQGRYGRPPHLIDKSLVKLATAGKDIISCRPADELPCELDKIAKEIGSLAKDKLDVLSYAMFPDVARNFLKDRRDGCLNPEPLKPPSAVKNGNQVDEFNITMHGESYHIHMLGEGESNGGEQVLFMRLDGVSEEVIVKPLGHGVERGPREQKKNLATRPGDVTVAIPSTIVELKVSLGAEVEAGEVVLIAEAMKMETEIVAPIEGVVKEIYCEKGDMVNPREALITIS